MWRFRLPFFLCLIVAVMPVRLAASSDVTTPTPLAADPPIEVKIWTWLVNIQNVNYPADELTVDMFVTFTYDLRFKDKINPMKHFEIVEAKNVTMSEVDEKSRPAKGEHYQSFRCIAVIGHHWDTRSFPFDRHHIHVTIEDSMDKVRTMIYVDDDSGREEITIRDREIANYSISVGEHTWGWGDAFSAYKITFTLEPQHPWGMFQKLFLTVFIALSVALLSFFVHPGSIDARFGLLVGSLFAAIANQYVVSNSLPLAGTKTLADTIHQLAYLVILLSLALSILSLRCLKTGREVQSQRIDRWGFRVLAAGYVTVVAAVVACAMARG